MLRDLIVSLFAIIDASDWEKLSDVLDVHAVYERPGYLPLVGLDRVRQFYERERMISSGVHHVERIVVDGEYGACWGEFVGTTKTGARVTERFADAYGFAEGRIRSRRTHFFRPAV